jgi:hypothetical protein
MLLHNKDAMNPILSAGWLLLAQGLIPLLLSIFDRWMHVFMSIAIDVTEYSSERNEQGCILLAKILSTTRALKLSRRILHNRLGLAMHAITIGKWFVATIDFDRNRMGYRDEESIRITVYTFRWHKPIISDDEATSKLPPNHLQEAVNMSLGIDGRPDRRLTKPPVNTRPVPASIEHIAKQVAEIAKENGSIIIQGLPGTGKTYSARYLAFTMGAILCNDFNPMLETPFSVMFDVSRENLVLVIVINEVEEMIGKMNKAEWNNLLDLVNNNPQMFRLIMTTNVPLERLIRKDIALLRDARATKLEVRNNRVILVNDDELMARAIPEDYKTTAANPEAKEPVTTKRNVLAMRRFLRRQYMT